MDRQTLEKRFPLGSRVVATSIRTDNNGQPVHGREGVVVCNTQMFVGVDFGDTFSGHDLDGVIETYTGWWCLPELLRLVDQPPEIEPEIEWDMIIQ